MHYKPRLGGKLQKPGVVLIWTLRLVFGLTVVAGPLAHAQEPSPLPRAGEVLWPDDEMMSASTTHPAFVEADKTLLPVLVPHRFLDLRSLRFVGEPLAYTVSARTFGASVAITGTRVIFDLPGQMPAAPQEAKATGQLAEKFASAGYVRFGVAYQVDVECEATGDRRCSSLDYVRELLDEVELVGGSRDGSAPIPSFPRIDDAGPPMESAQALADDFARPAGELLPKSGRGLATSVLYAPGMRFPVETSPSYLNSQVYSIGGSHGPKGGWSDRKNYRYPWRDNFCEARPHSTPMCPSGQGHQGQDIRPMDPRDKTHWAVAAEDGQIVYIGSYMVTLRGVSGTEYRYLHLEMAKLGVRLRQSVKRGQRIGLVSNDFGKTSTTVHLHFEIRQNLGQGLRHVPPYTSLLQAYRGL